MNDAARDDGTLGDGTGGDGTGDDRFLTGAQRRRSLVAVIASLTVQSLIFGLSMPLLAKVRVVRFSRASSMLERTSDEYVQDVFSPLAFSRLLRWRFVYV